MLSPSKIARHALRGALRDHPQAETVLQGRYASNLTTPELRKGLLSLGLDPDGIAAEALAGTAPTRSPRTRKTGSDRMPQPVEAAAIGAETETETETSATPDAIEAEVQTIRELIVTGGFSSLDARLRELVTEARKPAVEIRVEVPAPAAPQAQARGQVPMARPSGSSANWKQLFGVTGPMGRHLAELWDGAHPDTPAINPRYLWPHPQTALVLTQIARGRNVMLFGPAGTGKTEFAQQLAAMTGRPFALLSCDNGTDAATLMGLTAPDASGGTIWKDGALTKAIRTPGCIVCLDEPSVARPGALMVMQNVLANRALYIAETGERVPVAPGVIFLATDNTNGTGGGARRGYTDTNKLNAAFLDRFGVRVELGYLPRDREAEVLVSYTGCTAGLADLLVTAAAVTRAAAEDQLLSHGIGLRRLLSWAELLTDGVAAEEAFVAAILNCAPEADRETLREQCLLTYDASTVRAALSVSPSGIAPQAQDPAITNPTAAGRQAASQFSSI